MKTPKIQKNLSDKDMLKGYVEESSFETALFAAEEPVKKIKAVSKKGEAGDFKTGFFSQELQESVSKALLELKVALYKDGIVDYTLKVSQDGRQVILTAVPK